MEQNRDISDLSGFHTRAMARYFLEYDGHNSDDLRQAVLFAQEQGLPVLVVGGGCNSLFAFDEYPGLVIYNHSQGYELQDRHLRVLSGHSIWSLAEVLEQKHGIDFWHRFQGLPGSIGGAVFGNAGCFGLEIGPYVTSVEICDLATGVIFTQTHAQLDFAYRWSECKNHPDWFILAVNCDLSDKIEKYPAPTEEPLTWRQRVQPEGYSCGSFFKNPSREQSAGYLIEQVGLKGYRHGGAFFSDKHANFLISEGTATWRELVELVHIAQQKVSEIFHIQLIPEVQIITLKDNK